MQHIILQIRNSLCENILDVSIKTQSPKFCNWHGCHWALSNLVKNGWRLQQRSSLLQIFYSPCSVGQSSSSTRTVSFPRCTEETLHAFSEQKSFPFPCIWREPRQEKSLKALRLSPAIVLKLRAFVISTVWTSKTKESAQFLWNKLNLLVSLHYKFETSRSLGQTESLVHVYLYTEVSISS